MKKILLFSFSFLLISMPAFAASFSDVSKDDINFNAIEYLSNKGVINGYEDGTFKPDQNVNRAEAMKMIVGGFKVAMDTSYSEAFPDVKEDDWFFPFVMAGFENEIIKGYEDGTFKPEQTVNLAETLKMVTLAADVHVPDTNALEFDVFLDVEHDKWFAPYAYYAREHNVVMANPYGKVDIGQDIDRGEIAEIVYRMMVILAENSEGNAYFPLEMNWSYYHSSALPFKMKYDNHEWNVIENPGEVIFWKPDMIYSQFSPNRIYPNTAKVVVTLDDNRDNFTKNEYFNVVKNAFKGGDYTEFSLNGLSALEVIYSDEGIVDWYIYMSDGRLLVVYTQFGDGILSFQLPRYIRAMLTTLEYAEPSTSNNDVLSTIFENLLIEGKGMEMLDLLPEKTIIETDTLGVGTGPVDYYYCETYDYTFKYERASDLILDKRQGETSAF